MTSYILQTRQWSDAEHRSTSPSVLQQQWPPVSEAQAEETNVESATMSLA